MIPWFLLGGVTLLFGPGLFAMSLERLHPAHRARFLGVAFLTGLFVVEAGLVLWAAPVMLDLAGMTDLAAVCRRMLGGFVPGGTAGGVGAAVAATGLAVAAGFGVLQVRRAQRSFRVESIVAVAQHRDDHDLVVLPSSRPLAYSVGGAPRQIVLTSGVVDGLPPACVEAITAHEMVHVRCGHHRYLSLAAAVDAAFGWVPPVAAGVRDLRLSLERWADEDASLMVPQGRECVRRALLEAAMAGAVPTEVTGFGDPDMVARRVIALGDRPPTRFSGWLAVAYLVVGAGVVVTWATVGWAARMSVLAMVGTGRCLL